MKRAIAIGFGSLALVGAGGCFHLGVWVKSEFPAQIVEPAPTSVERLPINVAVIADPALTRTMPFDWSERMNPGLACTIRNAFSANFEIVTVADNGKYPADVDLVAVPSIDFSLLNSPFLMRNPEKLTMTFTDPRTGHVVAVLSASERWDHHAQGAYDHIAEDLALTTLDFIPVVSYFASDRVARVSAQHDLDRYNAGFASALVKMAQKIATKIPADPELRKFAAEKN